MLVTQGLTHAVLNQHRRVYWGSIAGSYRTPTGKEKGTRTGDGKWH
jgi:hypothetical protein